MIEPNDRLTRDARARNRRRKGAAWKSGLMITGLGAVVLGAGYLAGVNAPAVAQTSTPQAVAGTGSAQSNTEQNQLQAPAIGLSSDDGQLFQFNGDNSQALGGNSGGTFQSQGGGDNSQSQGGNGLGSTDQFNQQFGGRRSRQLRGFSQQQPGFGGPVTRSRGS